MVDDPKSLAALQDILRRISVQGAQLERLEGEIRRLSTDMDHWIKQRATVVDKIEYHFDQLKVEKLEGTLNIGLTPGGWGQVEDLAVNQKGQADDAKDIPLGFPQLRNEMHRYLRNEAREFIVLLEREFNYPQDETRRDALVADLARQMDPRIRVYLDQAEQGTVPGEERNARILEQLKSDVRTALEQYFARLQGKEEET